MKMGMASSVQQPFMQRLGTHTSKVMLEQHLSDRRGKYWRPHAVAHIQARCKHLDEGQALVWGSSDARPPAPPPLWHSPVRTHYTSIHSIPPAGAAAP